MVSHTGKDMLSGRSTCTCLCFVRESCQQPVDRKVLGESGAFCSTSARGANIGTTFTALLAALAELKHASWLRSFGRAVAVLARALFLLRTACKLRSAPCLEPASDNFFQHALAATGHLTFNIFGILVWNLGAHSLSSQ